MAMQCGASIQFKQRSVFREIICNLSLGNQRDFIKEKGKGKIARNENTYKQTEVKLLNLLITKGKKRKGTTTFLTLPFD